MPTDTRFPPKPRSELNDEQKTAYDEMSNVASSMFKDTYASSSSYLEQELTHMKASLTNAKMTHSSAPSRLSSQVATPHLASSYFDLVKAIGAIEGLPSTAREKTILATGSHYKASYEIYAHERVAVATTSLTQAQVDQIKTGKKPSDLDAAAAATFDVAIALNNMTGPLEAGLWEALVKEGALAVVHYVGVYAYTCVLLNACDVGVPERESIQ